MYKRGTGFNWDSAYGGDRVESARTYGVHIFNVEDVVVHVSGRIGVCVSRTALTAKLEWDNGEVQEIEQFDSNFMSSGRV